MLSFAFFFWCLFQHVFCVSAFPLGLSHLEGRQLDVQCSVTNPDQKEGWNEDGEDKKAVSTFQLKLHLEHIEHLDYTPVIHF